MKYNIDSPPSGANSNRRPMPTAPAIFLTFCLLAICAAAPTFQLQSPATDQNVQFFNDTTNAGTSGSAPPIFYNESTKICDKSPKKKNSTGMRHNDSVEAANSAKLPNIKIPNGTPPGEMVFKLFQLENLSNKNQEKSNNPAFDSPAGTFKNIYKWRYSYFIDTQAHFPPLAACADFPQQSQVGISKTDEGQSPAAESPPSTNASFFWRFIRYVFLPASIAAPQDGGKTSRNGPQSAYQRDQLYTRPAEQSGTH
jgi:hypothetical protein